MRDQLNAALKRITIRDPIKSLLNPQLEFIETGEGYRLSMKIDTIDSRTGKRLFAIEANGMAPLYLVGRLIRDERFMGKFVHTCLGQYLDHELSESIMIDDHFVVQPKHWGPEKIELNA